MQAYDVSAAQQRRDVDRSGPRVEIDECGCVEVMDQHVHAERARVSGDPAAESTVPDDADGPPRQLGAEEVLPSPVAGAHVSRRAREMSHAGEQERPRELCGRVDTGDLRAGVAQAENPDPGGREPVEVEMIETRRGRDDQPEAGSVRDGGGGHRSAETDEQDRVAAVPQSSGQIRYREVATIDDIEHGRQVSERILGVRVDLEVERLGPAIGAAHVDGRPGARTSPSLTMLRARSRSNGTSMLTERSALMTNALASSPRNDRVRSTPTRVR